MKFKSVLRGLAVAGCAAFASVLLFNQPLSAEDCPRGTLDKAYCDTNGDLVADMPKDKGKVVDPDTIIFSYTPVEDPAVYQKVWDGFIKHMAKVTGKKVVFSPSSPMPPSMRQCVPDDCTSPA